MAPELNSELTSICAFTAARARWSAIFSIRQLEHPPFLTLTLALGLALQLFGLHLLLDPALVLSGLAAQRLESASSPFNSPCATHLVRTRSLLVLLRLRRALGRKLLLQLLQLSGLLLGGKGLDLPSA